MVNSSEQDFFYFKNKYILMFFLFLLALLCSKEIENLEFKGSFNLTFPEYASSLTLSSHFGQKMYLSQPYANSVLVYNNTGEDFQLLHQIKIPQFITDLTLSSNGNFLLIRTQIDFSIWETENFTLTSQSNLESGYACAFGTDENTIIFSFFSGKLGIYRKNLTIYQSDQQIIGASNIFALSQNSNLLAVPIQSEIYIYEKESSSYLQKQHIELGYGVKLLKFKQESELLVIINDVIYWFEKNDGLFMEMSNYDFNLFIFDAEASDDLSVVMCRNFLGVLQLKKTLNGYETVSFHTTSAMPMKFVVDKYFFINSLSSGDVNGYFLCPIQCSDCIFPNNCLGCIKGYNLANGKCYEQEYEQSMPDKSKKLTYCVKNIEICPGICKEYCSKQCKTCNKTRKDCHQCAKFYKKDINGQCRLGNSALSIITKIRCFLNLIRRGGIKFLFLIVDDLWLYSFHKQKYDGTLKTVLDILNLVEEKQWQLLGLAKVKDQIENSVPGISLYNAYSNRVYMEEERKNNVFIQSTLQFFIFFIPLALLFVFVCNRIFYLLFNYRISSLLRPYSLWGVLFQLIIQNNIEYFSFLGVRSFMVPFSFDFVSKLFLLVSILMFFLVFFSMLVSYIIFYSWYGKLARYFLINMYRFPSSYYLMILLYGIRPFLKGFIHGFFHHHFVLQIWLLIGVEVLVLILTLSFQYFLENHKVIKILALEILSMIALVALNYLILLKHHYLPEEQSQIEIYLQFVIYFMATLLVLRLFIEYFWESISLKCFYDFCWKKNSIKPNPDHEQKNSQPRKEKKQPKNILNQKEKKKKRFKPKKKEVNKKTQPQTIKVQLYK